MPKEAPTNKSETNKISPEELKRIKNGVERAEKLATVLDDVYVDPIVGLFGGDAPTALAGLYIIYEAERADVPVSDIVMMLGRTGFDFLVGSIPIVGDIFDFFYKSNKKNAEVLRKHFEEISQNVDTTREDEELLVEKDRSKEKGDLKGLAKNRAKSR